MLNAVSFHTTGRANMSRLEKIIYLADAIEPNRILSRGRKRSAKWHIRDLDKACLDRSLEHSIDYVNCRGLYLDHDHSNGEKQYNRRNKKQRKKGE